MKKIGPTEMAGRYAVLVKYALVGSAGTAIDLGTLFVFVDLLHIHLLVATAFSFLLAVVNNFLMNKYWTFQNTHANVRKQFLKFLLVSITGLLFTEGFMALFVYGAGLWYIFSKAVTSALVLTWNFLANKYWTFKDRIYSVPLREDYACEVTVIVPAFNEEKRIIGTLKAIDRYFSRQTMTRQIIVVDDGSSDRTTDVVEGLRQEIKDLSIISYQPNRGKGYAVKRGVEESRGRYVLFSDADNSTPIDEFSTFYPILKETPVVIGSRYMPGSNIVVKQPSYRVAIGRVGNRLIRFFLLDDVHDTQCGFKAFQHDAAHQIFSRMKVDRFGFDIESLAIARLLGFPVREVPVSWFNSSESRIRPIKDALRTLGELIYIKLNLWGGRYS